MWLKRRAEEVTVLTRVKISVLILFLLIVFSIISGLWVNQSCNGLLKAVENVQAFAQADEVESAAEAADQLRQMWEHFRKTANVIVKSDKLSEIDRICSRIEPLLTEESDEINAELDELSKMISVLRDGEAPLLTSIF